MYPFMVEKPVDPESVNMDAGRLAKVVERFHTQQQSGSFPGGQLVLKRHGKLVLNDQIGVARGFRKSESTSHLLVQSQTPFPVLSAGKPLAAIAIAMLDERGLLDVSAPIADIFPRFAKRGKDQIAVLDVLTHRSGILMPDIIKEGQSWGDNEAIREALIDTVPTYARGTLAYHPHEYGWILNEVMLRVDGRSLAAFFVEEIATPLQLPALRFGLAGRDIKSVAFSYWLGEGNVNVAGVNVAKDFEKQNSKEFLNAENPATSLVTDASSLVAFYDFLLIGGKTPSGKQLISEKTIRAYTSRHVLSWDRSLNTPLAIGRGFVLGMRLPSSFGWWNTNLCFGHAGGFSSLAFGDYRTNISVAIVTNGNKSTTDFVNRFVPLAHGLRSACK
ncbi:MAG: beta-lactamase family protein [Anaerolineales bacterium]|nr:beta-lactamase family protein [Anaerolineales bacterium]